MPKFLNTSATTYMLEELIKNAQERIYIVSPYLKLNDKIKELLEDKNRLKIDVRIIYGKTELNPKETEWLSKLDYVRLSFCKNLHAKCYVSEDVGIITSLNMYEFSQVNNNEMGVLFKANEDSQLYQDCLSEVKRIIRISEEVRMNMEILEGGEQAVISPENTAVSNNVEKEVSAESSNLKITTKELAKQLGKDQKDVLAELVQKGCLEIKGSNHYATQKGKDFYGAQFKKLYGTYYFLWDKKVIELFN